jgi:hypothetical protein
MIASCYSKETHLDTGFDITYVTNHVVIKFPVGNPIFGPYVKIHVFTSLYLLDIDDITDVKATTIAVNDQTDPCSRCKFPFVYKDNKLTTCFKDGLNNWCSTKTDENGIHIDGYEQSCHGLTCGADSK